VPADPSSPIPAALALLTPTDPRALQDADAPHLLAYLAAVPDPRAARGRRHPLVAILGLAAAAVLAGARSIAAIAEWAADAPQPIRAALGARRDAPGHFAVPAEATIRRTLSHLDPEELAGAIGAWLADRDRASMVAGAGGRRAVAVDGKTLRGAHPPDGDGRPVHLLAAMEHATRGAGPTSGRRRPRGGHRLRPAPGRARLDRGRGHHRCAADPPGGRRVPGGQQARAHYLFQVKANQPGLLDRCQRLPWHRIPELDRTRDRGHGRIELRTLKAVSVHHFEFPHAAQILQVTRKTRDLHDHPWQCTTVTVYAVTSLPFEQASPARLADLLRGHWAIEALHHVRDVTFCEDSSQTRTGAAPNAMACLRNLIIGVLSRAGPVNVAAALRRHARDPRRPLATLGISLG
jgi:DDE_Tnp_1-associated/Transposase DDE domain